MGDYDGLTSLVVKNKKSDRKQTMRSGAATHVLKIQGCGGKLAEIKRIIRNLKKTQDKNQNSQ